MKETHYIDPAEKVVIDSGIKHVTIHSETPEALAGIDEYAAIMGKTVDTGVGNTMDMIRRLRPSKERALVYVNGGYLYRQRPSLANAIKKKLPNSVILMDFIDFFSDGQNRQDVREELEREYGIRNGQVSLEDVMETFKQKVNYEVTFEQYAEHPRKAFFAVIRDKK